MPYIKTKNIEAFKKREENEENEVNELEPCLAKLVGPSLSWSAGPAASGVHYR